MGQATVIVEGQFTTAHALASQAFTTALDTVKQLAASFPEIDFTSILAFTNDMAAGGVGIPQSVQDDIFALGTEQDAQSLRDAKDKSVIEWAAKNWSLPDGVMESGLQKAELTYLASRMEKSASIRQQALEIAVKQVNVAIGEMVKLGVSRATLQEKAMETGSQAAAQLVAGILSSAHAQASIHANDNVITSKSTNKSTTTSTTETKDTTTNMSSHMNTTRSTTNSTSNTATNAVRNSDTSTNSSETINISEA